MVSASRTLELDRDQWQQVKAALSTALKLPASERASAIVGAFADNPDLGAYAVDMLRYYDTATRLFDSEALTTAGSGGPVKAIDGPASVGQAIGSYRVLRRLGQGGMGVVYLAEDERLGRQVALKFLAHDRTTTVAESKARLLAESRSAAVLNHPAIVTLHDVLDIGDELVTVMEFVEGRSLTDLLAAGPVSLGYALRLTGQIADALAYAHGRGIAHCDLKPANIHVLPGGSPKILDFGLARALAGSQSVLNGPLFGTPGYLAPEQLLGRETTAACDMYALGVIFYQLLTGVPPFPFGDVPQLLLDTITKDPDAPSTRVPGIPPEVDELALRCLHKNPRQRLQPHELNRSINMVLSQLETAASPYRRPSDVVPTFDETRPPTAFSRLRQRAATWGVRVLVVVALAALSGLLTTWTFNMVVERPLDFDPDPLQQTLVIGFQSLVFPVLIACVALGLLGALQPAASFVMTRVGRATLRQEVEHFVDRYGSVVIPAAAMAVVALGLLSIGLLVLQFGDLLDALPSQIGSSDPRLLLPLHPDNRWHQLLYRITAPVLLVVLLVAWRAAAGVAARFGKQVHPGIRATAFSIMCLLGVMVQAPYKLTVHAQRPVVLVDDRRCYMLGERGSDARVYCPGAPVPRVRTVSRPAARISPCGFEENIFVGTSGSTCQ